MAITGRQRLRAASLTVAVAAVAFGLSIGGSQAAQSTTTEVQVLAFNDFHGNLAVNPATSSSGNVNGIPAGGAEYLTTHLKRLRAEAKAQGAQSVTVAAGDLIGASPLLSAACPTATARTTRTPARTRTSRSPAPTSRTCPRT